jgi:hypothetical protein
MKRKSGFLFFVMALAVLLTVGVAHESHAVLAAVGPVDPLNGFPQWYQDTAGIQLQPCFDAAFCGLLAAPGFNPALPIVFPTNFPDELFYWSAGTDLAGLGPAGTGRAVLVLAMEGAFNTAVVQGDQMTFSRIQAGPILGLTPGATYTIDHPFGTFTGAADGIGTLARFRDEFGCAPVPPVVLCDFSLALGIFAPFPTVGPFLRQLTPPPPPGFIGDGGLLGNATIQPGPNGDFFRITGPNIGGVGVNTVSTNNTWAITGQVFGVIPKFLDVPVTHPFFTQINAIADAGITGGCTVTPPNFCPDAAVSRKQMAVFMETSMGVLAAPPCAGNIFNDISPLTVTAAECGFIEDFAAKGITGGCGNGNFCPDGIVTRGQMAVFIEAALGVTPAPACAGNRFGDVNAAAQGAAFCGFIEDFSLRGITGGCQVGPPAMFCPSNPVTRGEMAVFLVAAPNPPLAP